ncbi:MAG TPA: transcriptional regulator, partial [Pantoea agglomerans]|nr:transcriptional regulator [Pantoea agglomerans]
ETEEILRIASQFSLNKCKIIAITNTESCSLAKIGDFNLCYHVPIIRMADNSDITTQVPVTYIIEAIGRQLGK